MFNVAILIMSTWGRHSGACWPSRRFGAASPNQCHACTPQSPFDDPGRKLLTAMGPGSTHLGKHPRTLLAPPRRVEAQSGLRLGLVNSWPREGKAMPTNCPPQLGAAWHGPS